MYLLTVELGSIKSQPISAVGTEGGLAKQTNIFKQQADTVVEAYVGHFSQNYDGSTIDI